MVSIRRRRPRAAPPPRCRGEKEKGAASPPPSSPSPWAAPPPGRRVPPGDGGGGREAPADPQEGFRREDERSRRSSACDSDEGDGEDSPEQGHEAEEDETHGLRRRLAHLPEPFSDPGHRGHLTRSRRASSSSRAPGGGPGTRGSA